MSARVFRRPARRDGPDLPTDDVDLQEPPDLPEVQPTGGRGMLMVLPTILMSGGMLLFFTRSSSGSGGHGISGTLLLGMMGLGMVLMLVSQVVTSSGDRKFRVTGSRRDYLRYLSRMRKRVRGMAERQRAALAWGHPNPSTLWSLALTTRLWERRPAHPDFGEVRIGTGPQRLSARLVAPQTKPVDDLEPVSAKALRRFLRAYTLVPEQPVALFVRGFSHIRLIGDHDVARGVLRAMLAQLVALHGPTDLVLAFCVGEEWKDEWEWAKWLPHTQHPEHRDAAGRVRLINPALEDLEVMLGEDFRTRPRFEAEAQPNSEQPLVVLVVDGGFVPPGARFAEAGYRNAVMIDLGGSMAGANTSLTIGVAEDLLEVVSRDRVGREIRTRLAEPDTLSTARMSTLARLLAGSIPDDQAVADTDDGQLTTALAFDQLLELGDLDQLDVHELWPAREAQDRLRVPIGTTLRGAPVVLDLKESAEGGMGPHGMLIGATGSGKSELLRTLVLALASTHSSTTLNFVLVDFKGGATFAGLEDLPHISAIITNLADEAGLVERMRDALRGELTRRQELLRSAGNFTSVRDYEAHRMNGAPLDPFPTLVVVVDEFSELIAAQPQFIEEFVAIGRLGRSLGVHLLLSSQRLDEGRIHQLEGHLSYRIGLRTFSAMESRSVIGVPDAYELPATPGAGYLRSDVSTITRFNATYVSGPYRRRAPSVDRAVLESQVVRFGSAIQPINEAPLDPQPEDLVDSSELRPADHQDRSVLKATVDRIREQGPAAHRVWLPPLDEPPTLDQILPPIDLDSDGALCADGSHGLHIPLGLVDKPTEQLRGLVVADLTGVGGHVGVVGQQQSGKSTLLMSLITGLALKNTPQQVQFYALDFGGNMLSTLNGLPHLGGVAGRHDPERVRRTVAEVAGILNEREDVFARLNLTGMPQLRAMRDEGRLDPDVLAEDEAADVFVVVDGWATMRQEFEDAEQVLRNLAGRSLNYGVHIIMTATRWSDMHNAMRDKVGTRLELRLGDPVESVVDLRMAATVPRAPGHGLTRDKLHFLGVLPRVDGDSDPTTVSDATRNLVEMIAETSRGPSARPVRTLPARLSAADLPPGEGDQQIVLGLDEANLAPVVLDLESTPHLTVLGDDESGKTNLLRLITQHVVGRNSPAEARIMMVDGRRKLFDDIPDGDAAGVRRLAARPQGRRRRGDGRARVPTAGGGRQPGAAASPRLVGGPDDLPVHRRLRPHRRSGQPVAADGAAPAVRPRHRPARRADPAVVGSHADVVRPGAAATARAQHTRHRVLLPTERRAAHRRHEGPPPAGQAEPCGARAVASACSRPRSRRSHPGRTTSRSDEPTPVPLRVAGSGLTGRRHTSAQAAERRRDEHEGGNDDHHRTSAAALHDLLLPNLASGLCIVHADLADARQHDS